jgi:hypothetical protein
MSLLLPKLMLSVFKAGVMTKLLHLLYAATLMNAFACPLH